MVTEMSELTIIVQKVRDSGTETVDDVRDVVDDYFEQLVYSLLKAEWDQLSDDEKYQFVVAVIRNITKRG